MRFTRPTIDGGLTLSIGWLLRDGWIRPGETTSGTIAWGDKRKRQLHALAQYRGVLGDESGVLWLFYDSRGRAQTQKIQLATSPQPFGGRRWWLICPVTGNRAVKLYSPAGYDGFASRGAIGLGYLSQRRGRHDRALRRAYDLRHKLGADGSLGDRIEKPKWMRWSTFDRKMAAIQKAEGRSLSGLYAVAQRIQAMIAR